MRETLGGDTGLGPFLLGGHLTITSRTQTHPQSTIPITPTTTRTAGTTGATGETAWAPGRLSTATRDTATITTLTITTVAAAAAGGAAMTETGTEIENEMATSPTAQIHDTIPTPTVRPQTACLLPRHRTPPTPPKSRPQRLLRDWMFPLDLEAQASQREALRLRSALTRTTMLVTTVLCLPLLRLLRHRSRRPR